MLTVTHQLVLCHLPEPPGTNPGGSFSFPFSHVLRRITVEFSLPWGREKTTLECVAIQLEIPPTRNSSVASTP